MRKTLAERALLDGATHVVVGCSGGPDSQVLLHALAALRPEHGCTVSALAIDHGLRPEAVHEIALARELAQEVGVAFDCRPVEVARGASKQAQARRARYAALSAHAGELRAERIAVGHTLDDQAETVLARLLRGASVEGLAAITPLRQDGVIRPLLDCRREHVLAYLREAGIAAASDPSNRDARYLRSRIRARHLPALCEENPALPTLLAALADDARAAGALLRARAEAALAKGSALALREEPAFVRRIALRTWVERATARKLARPHVEALDRMLAAGSGAVRVPGDKVVALNEAGVLSVSQVAKRGRGHRRPTEQTGNDEES